MLCHAVDWSGYLGTCTVRIHINLTLYSRLKLRRKVTRLSKTEGKNKQNIKRLSLASWEYNMRFAHA